ncbi:fibronectin type III domain-containing protein [Chryseobacterium sp. CT-SW4]|uniref:fibronectin type III domain-containing protein n=1 Tax=Chryseobacterium sp. SW-1 TaxID=3157343 RepID=UPI003B01B4FB
MKNYLALILCLLGSCLWAQRIVNLNEENATHSLQSSRQNVPAGYLKNAKASRAFTVNKALQSQQNTKAGDVIALQLFEGKSYNARISSVTTDVNNVLIITAKIIDYPMGYAIITTDKGTNKTSFSLGIPELNEYYTSAGNINSAATYLIELDKNNLNEISGVKNDDVVIPVSETKQQGKIPSLNTQAASKGVNDHANIDVMIVYTQDAETWANANKNGINNYLSTLMAYSNNVLSNSVAYASMTLVHSRKVSYTSVGGDLGTDLTRLRTMGDGYLDEVHTLRDQYAADLVSFIEKSDQLDLPGNGTCGLAYRLTNGNPTGNDTLGFSVIKTTDDFSNNTYCHESTFIHEIGHNIGMAHDAETSGDLSGNIIYPYAYGWRWTGNDGNKYRSIMSYNKGGETRVPYYSDPSVSHQGKPTGNASTANNALVFRNIKHYVAAYRENPTGLMAPGGLSVSAITGNGATLKWNAVSGATSYKVEYKTSAATAYTSVTVTTNTRVLTGLASNTVYNWRVTAINAGGSSSATSGTNFTTLAAAPSAPSGLAVSAITGNGATLKWNAVSGATSYKVEYKTSASTSYSSVTVTTNTRVLTGLAASTVYNWRVTAINAGGNSSAVSGTNFTTLAGTPSAPSAPSGLAVSAITSNGATLKWNAVSGATSYKVEYKTSASTSYSSVTVTTNTRVLTGLAASTVYNWRVTAINAGGNSSAVSGTNFTTLAGTPSAPSAPSGLAVSAITSNGATLKWNAVSGATSYKVEYKTSASTSYSSVTVTTNTRVLTGLAASTVYNWRVTAINAGGNSSAVSGTNFTTLAGTPSAPSAPSGLAVSAITSNGATLKWNAVSGATSYKVEYKTSASASYSSVTVTTNTRVLTGLAASTVYNWRVTAINAGGNSSAVSGTNFTTLAGTPSAPSAPSGLAVSAITGNGATLKWNAVSGATSYKVEYKTSASTSYSSVTVTTNTSVLTGLASSTVYNWRVTAINAGGSSSAVSGTNFTTLVAAPSAPSGLAVSAITSNGATLKWNAVSGATSYKVEYKTSASASYSSVTVTTNTRVLTGLAAGTVYNWRVTAINVGGSSVVANGPNFTTAPSTPSGLAVSAITANGATLKWNAVSGASSYKVEYKTSASTSYSSVTVTTNTRVLSGLAAGTVYNWRVTAINAGGSSVVANGANFTTAPPAPSGLNVSGVTLSGATLAWNAVSGASSYKVEYKTSAATTYTTMTVTSATRVLTGLLSNTTYNWRVSAINAGGSSTIATGSNFTTLVSAPSGLNVSGVTLSGATLAWNAVIGASSYKLEYKTSAATTYSSINLTTTSRALTGLPSNTTYNWRVSAINAGGSSTIATGNNFTTLVSAPSGLNVSGVTLSGATLAWNAVSGASSYKVEYKTSAATTYTTMTVTSATRVLTGLLSNTTYNWRVSAINAGGSSTIATGSNFTTLVSAPSGLNVSGVTLSGATLAWNAVSGASSYKVEYKTSAATTYTTMTVTSATRVLTGLLSNTTYNWRVSAINAGGSSTIATGSNFTTLVSAPSGLNVSGVTLSGATLAWNAVSGASSYKVEYKTSAATTYTTMTVTSATRVLTGLLSNTTYNWRVSAINGGGSSTVATGSNFTTLVSAPNGLNVSGVTLSGATLAWNAVIGASSYRLEYKTSSASTYSVINLTTTSRALTGLPSNTTYNWRVSAINAGGSSTIATGSNFTTLVSAPSGLNVSGVTLSGATLAWNAVSGASSYKVEYKTSAATTYTTMTVTSATRVLTGLLSNTTYNWRVSAINAGGSSTVATGSNFTTLVSAPNGLNVSGVTLSGATLAWNAVIGASSYKLEYKTSAATTYSSINLTTTSRALTGLPSNTTYNWRVSAINAGGSSTIATGSNFTTLVSAPSGLNVSGITLSGATLAWNAVIGASSYRLEYKTSSASTYSVINLTTTSRALTGLPSNTTYNWRVSAINAGGSSTVATGSNFTTLVSAPSGLNVSGVTLSGATLAWNAVIGASSYRLEYKTSSASTYSVINLTTTSRALTGLPSNTTYNWRVSAINAGGSSTIATGSNFTTLVSAPSGLNVSGVTLSGATLAWNAVSGASSYKVEYKTSAATTYTTMTVTSATRVLTGLLSNTTYNWRVSAINAGGSSTVATGSNFTTLVSAPNGLNVSGVTLSGATLAWNAVIGASSYKLEYKTSAATTYSSINLTTTSRALTGLPSNTTYNWRVSAINAGGSSTIATGSNFTTLVSAPSGLNVSGVTLSGATLAWNAVIGASSYKLEYKTSAATTYSSINLTTTSRALTGLPSNTTYNWRVSAINAGGSSTVATGSNFTTLVSAPSGLNVSGVTLSGATLAWNAVSGASSYRLEYKTSSASTYSVINLTTTSRALTGLPSNTTYNWRVSAINAGGSSTVATGPNFTPVATTSRDLDIKSETVVSTLQKKTADLYPNPAHDILYIRGLGNSGERTAVVIYNLSGQVVKTINVILEDKIRIDVSTLPESNYILIIKGNKFNFIKR